MKISPYIKNRILLSNKNTPDASKKDFDNTITTIIYEKNNATKDTVKLIVNDETHKSRHENINVFVNEEKFTFQSPEANHILNMGNCFKDFSKIAMDNLLKISTKAQFDPVNKNTIILPYLEMFSLEQNIVKDYARINGLSENIQYSLKNNPHLEKMIIPIKSVDHWSFSILEKNKNKWRLIIGETTSCARSMKFSDIKSDKKRLIELINNAMINSKMIEKSQDAFNYIEFKQYGNRGCGITVSLVLEAILKQHLKIDDSLFYQENDWKNSQVDEKAICLKKELINNISHLEKERDDLYENFGDEIFYVGTKEFESYNKITEELTILQANLDIVESEIRYPKLILVHDKSKRSNIDIEAVRRAQLAFKLEKEYLLKSR